MPTKSQLDKLSKNLRDARKKLKTWPAVNKALYDGKVGNTDLSRIANPEDDHWPGDKAIRDLLIPPPGPNDVAWRSVNYKCTKAEQDQLRKEKDPRERTIKTLKALKEK